MSCTPISMRLNQYSVVPVNEVVDDSIDGYQWSEKHPDQRKTYMEYVEEHLRDALISTYSGCDIS